MKILYVSRHFNHSGYVILKRLIKERIKISAVLLKDEPNILNKPHFRYLEVVKYWLKVKLYRGQFLKTINSEELLARKNGIKIIKTRSIKSDSFYEDLKTLNPDLIVLGGGWHELIPERVFGYPKYGCINTHPSLLPEFRGTSITRWQVLYGIEKSGSTIHFVDSKFDTGGVIAQNTIDLNPNWTPQELFYQLGFVGADLMVKLLRDNIDDFKPTSFYPKHNSNYYKYFSKWNWNFESLKIDWSKSLKEIHFFVMANSQESYEYLGPHTVLKGQEYFVRQTRLYNKSDFSKLDNIESLKKEKIIVHISKNKNLYFYRTDENWLIEIVKLQKVTNHKWKPSFRPLTRINFNDKEILNL